MAITCRPIRVLVSGVASVLALLGPATAALGAEASAASRARPAMTPAGRPAVPSPGIDNILFGVSCTSLASCWAVGQYQRNGEQLNQALHWNGRRWSQAATPDPGFTTLRAVSCPLPASCWAVGSYDTRNGTVLNEALHWDGRKWSQLPIPSPGGTVPVHSYSELMGVRCISPSDCWAVGDYTTRSGDLPFLTQALHWNGRRWSQLPTPSPGATVIGDRSELVDVRCASPGDCWAVGDSLTVAGGTATRLTLALHWNGRKWSQVASPDPDGTGGGANNLLSGVACAAPRNCWAAGSYGSFGTVGPPAGVIVNLMLHWNGREWSRVPIPNPAGTADLSDNELRDVTCTGPANCWAVGTFGTSGGVNPPGLSQALHWNGRRWARVPTPDPGGTASGDVSAPYSIRCTSAANCWAVGARSGPSSTTLLNLALRWNGIRWSAG